MRFDFQQYLQIDVLDYFRGKRSWRELYEFSDRLPYWGHYKSQMALDEDWARRICDMEDAGLSTPPTGDDEDQRSPLGYDPVVARLEIIADRVMATRTAVIASFADKHKEPAFTPFPVPSTALDRERERRSRKVLNELDFLIRGEGMSLFMFAEE